MSSLTITKQKQNRESETNVSIICLMSSVIVDLSIYLSDGGGHDYILCFRLPSDEEAAGELIEEYSLACRFDDNQFISQSNSPTCARLFAIDELLFITLPDSPVAAHLYALEDEQMAAEEDQKSPAEGQKFPEEGMEAFECLACGAVMRTVQNFLEHISEKKCWAFYETYIQKAFEEQPADLKQPANMYVTWGMVVAFQKALEEQLADLGRHLKDDSEEKSVPEGVKSPAPAEEGMEKFECQSSDLEGDSEVVIEKVQKSPFEEGIKSAEEVTKKFKCQCCEAVMKTEESYTRHILKKKCMEVKKYVKRYGTTDLEVAYEKALELQQKPAEYPCRICRHATFTSKEDLGRHLKDDCEVMKLEMMKKMQKSLSEGVKSPAEEGMEKFECQSSNLEDDSEVLIEKEQKSPSAAEEGMEKFECRSSDLEGDSEVMKQHNRAKLNSSDSIPGL